MGELDRHWTWTNRYGQRLSYQCVLLRCTVYLVISTDVTWVWMKRRIVMCSKYSSYHPFEHMKVYIDEVMHERRNSSVIAMELRLSYTNSSTWTNSSFQTDYMHVDGYTIKINSHCITHAYQHWNVTHCHITGYMATTGPLWRKFITSWICSFLGQSTSFR